MSIESLSYQNQDLKSGFSSKLLTSVFLAMFIFLAGQSFSQNQESSKEIKPIENESLRGDCFVGVSCPPLPSAVFGCEATAILTESSLPFSTSEVDITLSDFEEEGGQISSENNVSGIVYSDIETGVGVHPKLVTRTFEVFSFCASPFSCTQVFMIVDASPAVITECPPALTVEGCSKDDLDADAQTALPYSTNVVIITSNQFSSEGGSFTDNCGPQRSITYQDQVTGQDPTEVTRTFTVTDLGNSAITCEQIIRIEDTIAPTIECLGGETTEEGLALNPGFDEGTEDSGLQDWISFGNVFSESDLPRSGTHHAKMFGNFTGEFNVSGFFQEQATEAGEEWQGSMFMQSPEADPISGGNWALVKLAFFNVGGDEIAGFDSNIIDASSPQGEYIELSVSTIAPAGAVKVQLLALYLQPEFAGGSVYIDDASLVRSTEGAPGVEVDNDPGQCSAVVDFALPFATDNCSPDGIVNISSFDGTDDYVDMGDVSSTNFGTGDFTIETYVKTTFGMGENWPASLISKRAICNCSNFWNIRIVPAGNFYFESSEAGCNNYIEVRSNGTINDGQWHHIAVTRSGASISLYIDGVLDKSMSVPITDLSNADALQLGKDGCSDTQFGNYFSGQMDEVRIWNLARTATEIFATKDQKICSATGLIGSYDFDQESAGEENTALPVGELTDCSGNENNGTLQGFNGVTVTCDAPDVFPIGTTLVTCTAKDEAGNTSTCSFDVTVNDTETPTIDCSAIDPSRVNDIGECSFTMAGTGFDPNFGDNCSASITNDYNGGSTLANETFEVGTTTIRWTAIDAAGNTAECSIDIVISDSEAPVIVSCLETLEVNGCEIDDLTSDEQTALPYSESFALISKSQLEDEGGVFTDNCVPHSMIQYLDEVITNSPTVLQRTFIITDASGNTATCQQQILIEDSEAPEIICIIPLPVNSEPGSCEAYVTVPEQIISDNCEILSLVNDRTGTDDASGVYPVGTTVVWWTLTDASLNTARCHTEVRVNDYEGPMIYCPEEVTQEYDPELCGAHVNFDLDIYDACGGDVTVVYNPPSGTFFPVGNTTVTCTATDDALIPNSSTCTFDVRVIDTQAPEIIAEFSSYDLPYDALYCGAEVQVFAPQAQDECGIASIVNDYNGTPIGLDVYPAGKTTLVTWTVTDDYGNTSLSVSEVTVGKSNPATNLRVVCRDNNNTFKFKWDIAEGAQRYLVRVRDAYTQEVVFEKRRWSPTADVAGPFSQEFLPPGHYEWRVVTYCKLDDAENLPGWEEYSKRYSPWMSLYLPCGVDENSIYDDSQLVDKAIGELEVSIYPNPNDGSFFIQTDLVDYQLDIMDMEGKVTYSQTQIKQGSMEVNTLALAEGIYLLRLSNEQSVVTKRLVIRR